MAVAVRNVESFALTLHAASRSWRSCGCATTRSQSSLRCSTLRSAPRSSASSSSPTPVSSALLLVCVVKERLCEICNCVCGEQCKAYAVSGTHSAYGSGTVLRPSYAVSGTDFAYGATSLPPLP
eukprot:3682558-Rhodomonas_salina.2